MDLQSMLNAITAASRDTRMKYHLTLGGLIAGLEKAPAETVRFDHGGTLGDFNSYRGYYEDLAISSGNVTAAKEVLAMCREAVGAEYEGYKGGDYIMADDTPLWNAPYGSCGRAVTGFHMEGNSFVLDTKDIDW